MRDTLRKLSSGAARVGPAKVIKLEELAGFAWDTSADIAVVGFGGAGAAAAIEALEQGASVAVIDRFNGGGSTRISGGIVYAGGGTRIQSEAGITDSPENMYNYLLRETGDSVSEATLKKFCHDSAANLDWLMQHGAPFDASLCPFKTSYPSNDYYLYYSGNESFAPYSDTARPAPRGHRAHGRGVSGAVLFNPMQESVSAMGGRILTQHVALARGLTCLLVAPDTLCTSDLAALCGHVCFVYLLGNEGGTGMAGKPLRRSGHYPGRAGRDYQQRWLCL
jgi:3-oxo-5alpha-steroid 4-dehydrogenase